MKTLKKILILAAFAASATGANLAVASTASAGEGHWSIGHGVQCHISNGVVICTKSRP